jgi:hypothetical protein
MVGRFTHKRVDEVGSTECSSNQGKDVSTVWSSNSDVSANMGKDVVVTHVDKGKLAKV